MAIRIQTPEDWWKVLEANLPDLSQTIALVYCNNKEKYFPLQMELTAALLAKDNEKAHTILSDAWWSAPDHPMIRTWPSWFALCELCSEYWVFDSERMEEEG